MSVTYPLMRFEPGERTLTAAVLQAGRSLVIADLKQCAHIGPDVAFQFPNHSMLGLPLIVQDRKFAVLYLGYNQPHVFDQDQINRAEMAAQQIALALSKARLLEEAQKQVRQLTALHEVAKASTQVDSEQELVERVTGIIGENLFPDNFGILIIDEENRTLRAQQSYRFHSRDDACTFDIPLGQGITGQVAATGLARRIGDVQSVPGYIDMDDRINSELCVPIQLQERILGVINAESVGRDAFSADDERLLTILAGQLATAIERLRAADAERKWLNQLAHSNELISILAHLTTEIEKVPNPEDVIRTLGREFRKLGISMVIAHYRSQQDSFAVDHSMLSDSRVAQLRDSTGFPLAPYSFPADKLNMLVPGRQVMQPAILGGFPDKFNILLPNRLRQMSPKMLQALGVTDDTQLFHLPLVFEQRLLGVLWIWGGELTREDLPVLSNFAKQVGITLENARLFQEVQGLALTDPLTGLHNRRSLFELGRLEFARSTRLNRPISCMMLDLDHFKEVNDTYGHQVGDKVLQELARRCKQSVREIDLVGRYGGEELIILLPEIALEATRQVAQRLCETIALTPVNVDDKQVHMTVSIGVARMDKNTPNLETLIARADQAMYIAKHQGRNRVAASL
jgi:diguanylate cyclase (GGDEF)-like protein